MKHFTIYAAPQFVISYLSLMKLKKIILIQILIFSTAYCFAERIPRALPVPITKEGIIELSKSGVSDDVIISQIKATQSTFLLSNEEIIALKQAGVSDNVINFMVQTGIEIPRGIIIEPPVRIRYYYHYDPWYDYWWCDPWHDHWWWRHHWHHHHGVGIIYKEY